MPKYEDNLHGKDPTLKTMQLDSLLHRAIAALERVEHECPKNCDLCSDLNYIKTRRAKLSEP